MVNISASVANSAAAIQVSEKGNVRFDIELLLNKEMSATAFGDLKIAVKDGDEIALDALLNLSLHSDEIISGMASDVLIALYTDQQTGSGMRSDIESKSLKVFEDLTSGKDTGIQAILNGNPSELFAVSLIAGEVAKNQNLEGSYQNAKAHLHLPMSDPDKKEDSLNSQRFVYTSEVQSYISEKNFSHLNVSEPLTSNFSTGLKELLRELPENGPSVLVVPVLKDEHWSSLVIDTKNRTINQFDSKSDGTEMVPDYLTQIEGFSIESIPHGVLQNPGLYDGGSPAINGCAAFVTHMINNLDRYIGGKIENSALSVSEFLKTHYEESVNNPKQTEQSIHDERINLLYAGLKGEQRLLQENGGFIFS